jgi:hypothetical protein
MPVPINTCRFFWEGVGDKKKYHRLKSTEVYKPKDPGVLGLGVINTRILIKHLPNVKMDVAPVATNKKIRTFGIGELWPNMRILKTFTRLFNFFDASIMVPKAYPTRAGTLPFTAPWAGREKFVEQTYHRTGAHPT